MMKKGDTLIEVTLAVGIFSMVAIAVVSVMSSGTSSTQIALETTLAREEIDAQAEALRFIQASYIADKDSGDSRYADIWKDITDGARTATSDITTYAPASCADIYDRSRTENIFDNKGFVINTHRLGDPTAGTDDILVYADKSSVFNQTTTYPRLLYSNKGKTEDAASIVEGPTFNDLYRAEGIYVLAVKDTAKTHIVSGTSTEKKSAYYDFYIRTCWYGSGANTPSTISTVIRLYDPDVSE